MYDEEKKMTLNRVATRIYWTGKKFHYGDGQQAWQGDHVHKVEIEVDREPDGLNGTWGFWWNIDPKEVG